MKLNTLNRKLNTWCNNQNNNLSINDNYELINTDYFVCINYKDIFIY